MVIMHVIILSVLLGINAFFSASEVSLISLKPTAKMRLNKGDYCGRCLQFLLGDSGQFLATVQLGMTLAGFLASAFAADTFSDILSKYFKEIGFTLIDEKTLDSIIVVLITLFMSYLTTVVGELFPKRIGIQYSEQLARKIAIPIFFLMKIVAPFVWLLKSSVSLLVKIFGLQDMPPAEISKEEICQYLELGRVKGIISGDEKAIVDKIFDLGDHPVAEIMTVRSDITAVPIDVSINELDKLFADRSIAYLPVYEGNSDNIVGIIESKTYIFSRLTNPQPELKSMMSKAFCWNDTVNGAKLLREMQTKGTNLAVLTGNSGVYTGIISNFQLIQQLVS